MQNRRLCPSCDHYFTAFRSNQLYCCRKCAKRAEGARYRQKHRAAINQHARELRAAERAIRTLTDSRTRTRVVSLPTVYVPRKDEPKGPYVSYGQKAARALLEQQAREMAERREKFYAALKGEGK